MKNLKKYLQKLIKKMIKKSNLFGGINPFLKNLK